MKGVVEKLTDARGIISKLKHFASLCCQKVYFSVAYSHLQYGVFTWGTFRCQVYQQNSSSPKLRCKGYHKIIIFQKKTRFSLSKTKLVEFKQHL